LAKDSYARPQKNTKAELYLMLAEAVRNTQQQSVDTQPEPVRDVQREPKRKMRPAPKRPAKNKSVRASASRKSRPKSKSRR
jgi:hypothetical protein